MRHPLRGILTLLVLGAGSAYAADLMDMVRLAEEKNPDYLAVQSSRDAVRETRNQARARLTLPVVTGQASVDYNWQDITSDFGGGDSSYEGHAYQISVRQPVFHYDRWIGLRQTDSRIQQSELQVAGSYQSLLVNTADRYFGVLQAEDDVTFARAQKDALARQLEQAKQRFEVGLIAITDVQEAQSGYDLAVADEIAAVNALDNAREALHEVTGVFPDKLSTLGDSLPLRLPQPESLDEWVATALKQNLDVAAARTATEIAQKEIELQRAGHLPTLDLVGANGFQKSGGRFGNTESEASQIGLELNVPIYEGGQVVSRTREAGFRYEQSLQDLEKQQRATQRLAHDAYLGVVSGVSRVKALAQAVISTQTSLDATRAGFEVGTRTAVDVVDAERQLARARADLAQARYKYVVDTLRLKQAAGTLSPQDLVFVNSWLEP